jgi:Na+/H+-dicarboxylate symporter
VSLSTRVLIGLGLGIATGVFFGESAARLQIVGNAFIMLLQMTVMPFIAVSLTSAVGKLTFSEARNLALKAGAFLLVVWGITLLLVAVVPFAFPQIEAASFFSTSLVAEREPFDFLALYIPSNPIFSLAHNVVPALVLFSTMLGVALIGIERKDGLIRALDILAEALTRMSGFIARLAPIGVFALIGSAAGTLPLQQLERLQVYVITYALLALLLTYWILPGLVAALTPLRWKDIVPPTRDAVITAFAAGNLLIVIPILTRQAAAIAAASASDPARAAAAVDVVVPASFNFPSAGKLLSLAFVPFAAWLVGSSISLADYPQFLATGLFTFFAVTSIAIPLLLDFLRIPADLFEIFLAVDVITGRLQVMVAAMSTVTLALLGAFAMSGSLRLQPVRLARFAGVSVGVVAALLLGARLFYANVLNLESTSYRQFVAMDLATAPRPSRHVTEEPPVPEKRLEGSRLARIDAEKLLRVCYFANGLPMAFVNANDKLVGFDIEMAHDLAHELGVEVEFIRVDRSRLPGHLRGGTCDIAMSGRTPTPERTRDVAFSNVYQEFTLAFVSEDHLRGRFRSWETLRSWRGLHLAAPSNPHFLKVVRQRLPDARITPIDSVRTFFRADEGTFDGLLAAAEAASAWTMIYPRFAVVVPDPGRIKVPLAYPMPRESDDLVAFVNAWLELRRGQGAIDALFQHWILGRADENVEPRWSILHNVLHWGEDDSESDDADTPETEPPSEPGA